MKGKIYLIENQDNKLLGLFGFLKMKIVCKDDVFLAYKATNVFFLYHGVQDGYAK